MRFDTIPIGNGGVEGFNYAESILNSVGPTFLWKANFLKEKIDCFLY